MSDVAVRVQNLSKQYTIGGPQARYQTFRDALVQAAGAPLRWWKGGRAEQNTIWALDDISFEIRHGEAVGIIGRNGAGKSTLLKILSRITRPTKGRVDLFGRVGSLLEVGTGFHPELTGRENIFLNGAILGMTRREIERKFDEIVDFAEIERFLETPVKHYSSGMYVRLAFAVAAYLEPEILVVDEVLAVGDSQFQQKCLGKMGDVARIGRTVIFVSHQLDMIRALCKKTLLLGNGQLLAMGDSEPVIDDYLRINSEAALRADYEISKDTTMSIQVLRVRLRNTKGEPQQAFDVFEPIHVVLDYFVHKSVIGAIVCLEVKRNGVVVFWSFDTDTDENLLKQPRQVGMFQSEINLPCPLLKPGNYTLSVYTGIANTERIQTLEDILSFEVEILSTGSTHLSYAAKRPGIIATSLNWKNKQIQ